MKGELQEKLYKKYPKIFKQKDLSMQQTCMCWGIECGGGWYFIIDRLCDCIQKYIDNNEHLKIPQVEATQVKEKYGGLRFYISGGDKDIFGMISLAEHMSEYICEHCGSIENVSKNTKGWIRTLCNKCRENLYKNKEWRYDGGIC